MIRRRCLAGWRRGQYGGRRRAALRQGAGPRPRPCAALAPLAHSRPARAPTCSLPRACAAVRRPRALAAVFREPRAAGARRRPEPQRLPLSHVQRRRGVVPAGAWGQPAGSPAWADSCCLWPAAVAALRRTASVCLPPPTEPCFCCKRTSSRTALSCVRPRRRCTGGWRSRTGCRAWCACARAAPGLRTNAWRRKRRATGPRPSLCTSRRCSTAAWRAPALPQALPPLLEPACRRRRRRWRRAWRRPEREVAARAPGWARCSAATWIRCCTSGTCRACSRRWLGRRWGLAGAAQAREQAPGRRLASPPPCCSSRRLLAFTPFTLPTSHAPAQVEGLAAGCGARAASQLAALGAAAAWRLGQWELVEGYVQAANPGFAQLDPDARWEVGGWAGGRVAARPQGVRCPACRRLPPDLF